MSAISDSTNTIQPLTTVPAPAPSITDEPGTPTTARQTTQQGTTTQTQFSSVFEEILSRGTSDVLNEEELYAASIAERLESTKDTTTAQTYHSALQAQRINFTRASDGYVSEESAAQAALASLVDSGVLTQEEGDSIHTESFAMAQLDDNPDALFDGRGSESDASIATASRAAALAAAGTVRDGLTSGDLANAFSTRPLTAPAAQFSTSSLQQSSASPASSYENLTTDGNNTFLFKPRADHTGNLVILTPAAWNGSIDEVSLRDSQGTLIETARYTGVANGNRGHFRFNKPGGAYSDNLTVEIAMSDGTLESILIKDPENRYEE